MGWIAGSMTGDDESSSCVLRTSITLGSQNKVLVTCLESHDNRMGVGQIWFDDEPEFSWNISSWHQERTSVPETVLVVASHLPRNNQKVTMNLELLNGSAHQQNEQARFILLGSVAC